MASTPTTKSQVQAYQFVLRRMQSALVRRDAVMLHDPMRNHSRATAVGVVLGVVGTSQRHAIALVGLSVGLGARLLKQVEPGGIIASSEVIEALQTQAPALAATFHLEHPAFVVPGVVPASTSTTSSATPLIFASEARIVIGRLVEPNVIVP